MNLEEKIKKRIEELKLELLNVNEEYLELDLNNLLFEWEYNIQTDELYRQGTINKAIFELKQLLNG